MKINGEEEERGGIHIAMPPWNSNIRTHTQSFNSTVN